MTRHSPDFFEDDDSAFTGPTLGIHRTFFIRGNSAFLLFVAKNSDRGTAPTKRSSNHSVKTKGSGLRPPAFQNHCSDERQGSVRGANTGHLKQKDRLNIRPERKVIRGRIESGITPRIVGDDTHSPSRSEETPLEEGPPSRGYRPRPPSFRPRRLSGCVTSGVAASQSRAATVCRTPLPVPEAPPLSHDPSTEPLAVTGKVPVAAAAEARTCGRADGPRNRSEGP